MATTHTTKTKILCQSIAKTIPTVSVMLLQVKKIECEKFAFFFFPLFTYASLVNYMADMNATCIK